jgi:hypothetical protein
MLLLTTLLPALALVGATDTKDNPSPSNLTIKVVHEFPIGTWIENMALRPSGSVLAIDFSAPNIYEVPIDGNSESRLVHTFTNASGVSGIAESFPDTFFVVTGNFSFSKFSPIPATYSVHRLDFDNCTDQPNVRFVGAIPTLIQPNGILSVPKTPYLLIADSIAGKVYRYNTETLDMAVYFDHPLLKPAGTGIQGGVNGLKFSRGYFYFSNSNQEIVARVRVFGREYTPVGGPEVVASQTLVDDFIVNDYNGDIYLAENGLSELGFVSGRGNGTPLVLAGSPNSTTLAGPTAALWVKGEEGKSLLVSSTGGLSGYLQGINTVGGRISLVCVHGEC